MIKYDVYTCLAGNSSTRKWFRSYKTEAAAKAQATRLTGNGIIGKVEVRNTVTKERYALDAERDSNVRDEQLGELMPDSRDVALKSYPLTRHLVVEIDDSDLRGSREDKVPSIRLTEDMRFMVHMTWNEARALADALNEITDIAENG